MNNEPLPQIHLIRDTDLITFAYELHIFAGDFLRESEFNIHSLVTNTGADSIAIMGKNHMWLSDALHAYCSTADLHQMIFTTEYIGARAFLFHTDRKEDGRLYGDVMMLDLDNPDLRNVKPPQEQPQAQTVDLAALIEQLQKSPELASTLAALIAGQKAV